MPNSQRPSTSLPQRPSTVRGLVGTVFDAVIDGRLDWRKTALLLLIITDVAFAARLAAPAVAQIWMLR